MAVNYRTLSMKEKLELKDSQVVAIKNINLKYFNAISQISKSHYADRTTYEKAVGQLKQVYQHDIFQTLTHQQRKNWQSIIEEDCLHIK